MATFDFTPFLQRVRERVARSLRDGGYARAEGADRADLYGTAAAIGILAATGDRPRGGRAMDLAVRVRGWQEADGRFSDPTHGDLHRAATGVATLALLGDPPEVPAFADELLDATVVDSFLEGLDWSHPWPASHQAAGLLSIGVLSRADDTRRRAEWLSAYTSWLDANVDQRTGLWRGGQMGALADDPGLFGNLGCSFHVHFLYSWLARPWPVPSGVVDTGLALYSKPGAVVGPELTDWGFRQLDWAYSVGRASRHGHRQDEVRSALEDLTGRAEEVFSRPDAVEGDLHVVQARVGLVAELAQHLPDLAGCDRLTSILDLRPFI